MVNGNSNRVGGTIARLFLDKGFGFITGDDRISYFLHSTEMADGWIFDALEQDTRVTFTVEQTPKGPRAKEIRGT